MTHAPRQGFAGRVAGKVDSLTGIRGLAALWMALFHFSTYPELRSLEPATAVAQ
jgi:peptidoglycan/LPS O-acetylase OafA/YrhL